VGTSLEKIFMNRPMKPVTLAGSMLLGLVILAALVGLLLLWPLGFGDLGSRANPATSYDAAMARLEEIKVAESEKPLSELGGTIVLSHGRPTERVFVLLHGLTNAPEQFRTLGEQLYERGANVVIPRLAHHGLADRMNTDQANLRASDLISQAETGLDIAVGLGQRVTVVGLSVSGVAAAWIAQHRAEPEAVFLLAPFFGPKDVPDWLTPTVARAMSRIPNGFVWWDGTARDNLAGSAQVYPRFATRQIGETLRLGLDVVANRDPLKVKSVHAVMTEADGAVNNDRTKRLMAAWEQSSPETTFKTDMFPASQAVPHDFIDPNQPDQQVEMVYPKLIDWLMAD
jgi:pimeloyl-ACP methyl ester carboxylesterase